MRLSRNFDTHQGSKIGTEALGRKTPAGSEGANRKKRSHKSNRFRRKLCSTGFWLIILGHALHGTGCLHLACAKDEPRYLWGIAGDLLIIAVLLTYRFWKKRRRRRKAPRIVAK